MGEGVVLFRREGRKGGEANTPFASPNLFQKHYRLTSSTKKAEGSEKSVVAVNCTRTVCPA